LTRNLWCGSLIIFFLTLCFCADAVCQGQVVQPERFEIPIAKDESKYEVITAGENGMFLCRRVMTKDGKGAVEIIKLDTAFNRAWQGYVEIDPILEVVGRRTDGDSLYLLLRHPDFAKKDLTMFVISQANGDYVRHKIRNFIPLFINDFQIAKSGVLIGAYYNYIPVVLFYSFKTLNSKILPGLSNEQADLTQIKVNDDGTFDVLVSARTVTKQKTIWTKSYDAEGNLQFQTPLIAEENKNLLFARSISAQNDFKFIAGTYGNKNSEYSRGIFISTIGSNGGQQIRYYNYADFTNFFKYLKARREMRIKERIERRKVKGKKVRFNYRFIVHEIVPYNNQFILLGEAFYPKYISADPRFGGFFNYSRVYNIYNGRIFDGFYYTHAVVMGFDANGRLLWDNSFEINDVKTYTLEQFVRLEIQDDRIVLLYLFENEIRSKIIRGNEVLEGKTSEPIRTTDERDVARNNSSARLDYWYDDYFFATGVQNLANYQVGDRRVFFINKVRYSGLRKQN
jgi:hypothetical protein